MDPTSVDPVQQWYRAANSPDPDDPELYPTIDEGCLEIMERYGETCSFEPGEILFEQGQTEAPFFVVTSGRVVFFDRNQPEENRFFAEVGPSMFVGDVAMLTGEATIAECRAYEPTRALRMERPVLRRLVAENSSVGDLILQTLMARRTWLQGHGYGRVKLVGSRWSPEAFRLRDFLARNQVPFTWHDVETDREARRLLEGLDIAPDQVPVLVTSDGVHRRPTVEEMADILGVGSDPDQESYDLVVIGAGPAGLAAAVYGASEGLGTLVVEADSPGGQAGTSSKIENYLGFPTGVSGDELTHLATLQAKKFGVTLSNPREVVGLTCQGGRPLVHLDGDTCEAADGDGGEKPSEDGADDHGGEDRSNGDGEINRVQARAVVIATGAHYRRLECTGGEEFDGRGIYYGASYREADSCRDELVMIVGGGNSAGQAAVHLSEVAGRVLLVVRGEGLEDSMSRYLIDRIRTSQNIELLPHTEVTEIAGDEHLERVVCRHRQSGEETTHEPAALFVMIGATPRTDWLEGCVGLDPQGFVVTGADAARHPDYADHWNLDRAPFHLETTRPGIFAVGDVRSGSIKRVASAVGEGSMAIAFVHQVLEGR